MRKINSKFYLGFGRLYWWQPNWPQGFSWLDLTICRGPQQMGMESWTSLSWKNQCFTWLYPNFLWVVSPCCCLWHRHSCCTPFIYCLISTSKHILQPLQTHKKRSTCPSSTGQGAWQISSLHREATDLCHSFVPQAIAWRIKAILPCCAWD